MKRINMRWNIQRHHRFHFAFAVCMLRIFLPVCFIVSATDSRWQNKHSRELRNEQMNCLFKLRIYILIHFLIFMCNCKLYHSACSLSACFAVVSKHSRHATDRWLDYSDLCKYFRRLDCCSTQTLDGPMTLLRF